MYVCICHPTTDKQIRQALDTGAKTTAAVLRSLGHKVQCGKCIPYVREMVEDHRERARTGGCAGGGCACPRGEAGHHDEHHHHPEASNQDLPLPYGVAAE